MKIRKQAKTKRRRGREKRKSSFHIQRGVNRMQLSIWEASAFFPQKLTQLVTGTRVYTQMDTCMNSF